VLVPLSLPLLGEAMVDQKKQKIPYHYGKLHPRLAKLYLEFMSADIGFWNKPIAQAGRLKRALRKDGCRSQAKSDSQLMLRYRRIAGLLRIMRFVMKRDNRVPVGKIGVILL